MDDKKIFLVPMAKKKYAQFSFGPAFTMQSLLNDCKIPYQISDTPFTGKRGVKLIKADKQKLKHYVVALKELKKVYHFYFASNVIDRVLDYYKIKFEIVGDSRTVNDIIADMIVEEINTRKINTEKETNKGMFSYKARQYKSGLESWYVCKVLDIKFSNWEDIRQGRKSLASTKLDKFMELLGNAKKEIVVQKSEKAMIDKWFDENKNLGEFLDKFNVSRKDASADLGISEATLSRILSGDKSVQARYLFYYYVHDENNRRNSRGNRRHVKKIKGEPIIIDEVKEEATIDEIINEEEPKVETVAQESSFKIDDTIKEYAKKVEEGNEDLKVIIAKQESLLAVLGGYKKRIEMLEEENKNLKQELARYKHLIDLSIQRESK